MLHSLKPVKNTTNLTANLTEASMLNPITSTKNKTNLMEASMLNTLKTNLILTRAVLIALFAGLFILAACGGGGAAAPTTPAGPGTNACDANPFGPTCTRPADATARATAITDCATSIDTKATENCAIVPDAVRYCLSDPLDSTSGTTACDATAYDTARQGSGVTLAVLETTRLNLCREGSNRNDLTLCTSAVVQNCGDDANPFDLLCGRLNPARDAIIEKCVDSATLADSTKNADCVAARTAGFTCFDNPWADSCLTSTMYREFASFRDDAQTSRLAYCLGDDADVGVCGSALAQVCVDSGAGANPFDDLCMATGNTFDSVRADFATNCFNDENNGADCTVTAFEMARTGDAALCDGVAGELATNPNDPTCMTTPVTVASCSSAPFSTDCRGVDTFAGARTALFGICTNGVVDDKDSFCDADGNNNGGFTADEITCLANPFTTGGSVDCGMLFTALGGTVADVQSTLITACTGDGADGTNPRCTIAEEVVLTDCLRDPFVVDCDTALGATNLMTAQSNVLALCTAADSDNFATNSICTRIASDGTDNNGNINVKTCLNNPFTVGTMLLGATTTNCETVLGGTEAVTRARANLIALCTGADADGANTLCTIAKDTEETVALTVALKDCLANPFGTGCDTELGDSLTTAQNNLIEVCTGADADGSNTRCAILGDVEVTTCLANPFDATCVAELGMEQATTAQMNIRELCTTADSDNFRTNTVCTNIPAGNVRTCLDNPFTATVAGTIDCEMSLGDSDAVARAQANLNALCFGDTPDTALCTPELKTSQFCSATAAGADPFHAYCEDVANIDAADTGVRALFCDEPANASDTRCATQTTCVANPFASDCLADGNIYADNRDRAIAACEGVAEVDRDTSPLCMGVEIKAEIPAVPGGAALVPAVNLAHCVANPFLADCADGAFDSARTSLFNACDGVVGDKTSSTLCTDVEIKAEIPMVPGGAALVPAVTLASCFANPYLTACADGLFDGRRDTVRFLCTDGGGQTKTDACGTVVGQDASDMPVTVQGCLDAPFSADCTNGAFDSTRMASVSTCAGVSSDARTGTACEQVIIAADATNDVTLVTVATCTDDPFASGCETLDAFAGARCTANPFYADCLDNASYDGARCMARPFDTGCATDSNYDTARDAICAPPSGGGLGTAFNSECTEADYPNIATARQSAAGYCLALPDSPSCDTAVSSDIDAPTARACGYNPFTAGCDAELFNTVERQAAYCADDARTIFDTNCDSRTGIATARGNAIGECVAFLTTNKNDASCTGRVIVAGVAEDTVAGTPAIPAVTVGSCLDDPFHTACASDLFDEFRADHMEVCMSNGNAKLPSCTNINTGDTTYQTCLRNPFDTACMSSTSGHRYRNARAARYAFCEGSRAGDEGGTGGLCAGEGSGGTGTTIRSEICSYDGVVAIGDRLNPFAGVCGDDNADAQIDYCGVGDNSKTQDSCTDSTFNTTVAAGCLENPFSTACTTATTDAIDADVRTRITTKRVAYCREAAGEDFDATLCNLDAAVGVENEICASQGANGDPFSGLCTLDDADFATERAAFVQACDALVKADSSATALAGGATCTASIIACNADAYDADCVDEAAYSSVRQVVIADCESDTPTNALCTSNANIVACLANPYLIRAAVAETAPGADDAVAGLNCAGNADYSVVRTTLEDTTCVEGGAGDAARCPILVANVCGEGTDVGSNPFNSDYCFAPSNTFDVQRKTLVDSCVGVTTATDACTQEIIDCIANPFATSGITTRTSTVACDATSVSAAFVNPTITYCGTGSTTGTANISLEKCQMFATTDTCVANPFGSTCTNAMLGGDDDNDALTAARTLRTTYCSGLGTSSATIRGDSTAGYCLGAVENFCTGDNLFASATGAGVFDCLTDEGGTYNADRIAQYALCAEVASNDRTTAGTECMNTQVAICTTTNGAQTNPWAAICAEQSIPTLATRLAVVTECALITDPTVRGQNPRCRRTGAELVYTTCSPDATNGDPRNAACDDYADVNEPFNIGRLARYATGCAGDTALTGGNQEALCPADAVRGEICTDSGENARPFAPICTQTTDFTGIGGARSRAVDNCLTLGITTGLCATEDGRAGASVTAANSACAGFAATDNPFNAAVTTVPGFSTFNCNNYNAFDPAQDNFRRACRDSSTDYNKANCSKGTVLADVCKGGSTLTEFSNPFNTELCIGADADTATKTALAALCVNQSDGDTVTGGATCRTPVINCANNPFTPTTCDDAGYNGQKTAVLDLCKTGAGIVADTTGRCDTAVGHLACLEDPDSCTQAARRTQFAQASGSGSTANDRADAYRTAIRTDRIAYCVQENRINEEQNICRTSSASGLYAICLQNPFASACSATFGGDSALYAVRRARRDYCSGLDETEILLGDQTNLVTVSKDKGTGSEKIINLCYVADTSDSDAIGWLCYGTDESNTSGADKTKDPFTAVCRAFSRYDDRRRDRLTECAGASSNQYECGGYNAARLLCNVPTNVRPATGCPVAQTYTQWNTATTTSAFSALDGTTNQFLSGLTASAPDFSNNANLEQVEAGRILTIDGALPSIRFFSARTPEVIGRTEVIQELVDSDDLGNEVTLADGTVIPVVDSSHYDMVITEGVTPITPVDAGATRFYAGIINNTLDVGAPLFDRAVSNATWTGTIDWIGQGTAANATARTGFKMRVNYSARTIQGAIPIAAGTNGGSASEGVTGNHLVINGSYTGAGIISGDTSIRDYTATPNPAAGAAISIGASINGLATAEAGTLRGIIGHKAAVGVFISNDNVNTANGYSGGFIVTPPAGNQ